MSLARARENLAGQYAGTEPSAIFRSDDGGETWRNCEGLINLPSAGKWSFPPRPEQSNFRNETNAPHY